MRRKQLFMGQRIHVCQSIHDFGSGSSPTAKELSVAFEKAFHHSSLCCSSLHLPRDSIELIIIGVKRLAGLQDHRCNGERHDCQG